MIEKAMCDSDYNLLQKCLVLDHQAWIEIRGLIERLTRGLAASRFHLNHDDIEDVIQCTLLELLKNNLQVLRAFQGRSLLSTYLATIILRNAATHAKLGIHETLMETTSNYTPYESEYRLLDSLTHQYLWQLLAQPDSTILRMVINGYLIQEIADALNRSYGYSFTAAGIRKRKERALKYLRQRLVDFA